MPWVAAVAVIASVVGTAYQVKAGQDAKKDAKKQQAIQAAQRRLQIAREKAVLQRETRIRRAAIVNKSNQIGLGASSVSSQALQGLLSKQSGELDYLDQGMTLALAGDEITKRQLTTDATAAQVGAISSGLAGLGSKTGQQGIQDLTDLFA